MRFLQKLRRLRESPLLIPAGITFVCFLLFYGITARGALQTSDESAVFATGAAVAMHGTLAIDELDWLNEHVSLGKKGPDGHLYCKYFPGNIFGVALIYKLAARAGDEPYIWVRDIQLADSAPAARLAMSLDALWGALAMTALLLLVRRYFDWRTAIATVVLMGICSSWWYQARGLYSEGGAGCFLILSLCFAAYEKPYGCSTALALSFLFRPTNLIGLPIWVRAVWGNWRQAVLSSPIIAAGGLTLALFNWVRFGSPLDFGYYGKEAFSGSIVTGLNGLFFSPGGSIFVYSPVLLLAIPGIWLFFKREKSLTIAAMLPVLGYVVVIAAWYGWTGGASWGCRLLIPIVPLLGFFIAPAVAQAWKRKWLAAAIALLAVAGFSVQVLALLRDPLRVMIEHVANGEVNYNDTLYTVHDSWMALQIRSLSNWQSCDLDSYNLRHWFTQCPK